MIMNNARDSSDVISDKAVYIYSSCMPSTVPPPRKNNLGFAADHHNYVTIQNLLLAQTMLIFNRSGLPHNAILSHDRMKVPKIDMATFPLKVPCYGFAQTRGQLLRLRALDCVYNWNRNISNFSLTD